MENSNHNLLPIDCYDWDEFLQQPDFKVLVSAAVQIWSFPHPPFLSRIWEYYDTSLSASKRFAFGSKILLVYGLTMGMYSCPYIPAYMETVFAFSP